MVSTRFRPALCLVMGLFSLCAAAQVITPSQLLQTALSDKRVAQNREMIDFAGNLKYKDPWLRQIAARVGVNGSALGDTIYGYLRNEDTYNLQVGFNNMWERRRQQRIKSAQIGVFSAETRLLEQQALLERYQVLATVIYGQAHHRECLKFDSLLSRAHYILREMLTTHQDVKISKVLDVESDRNRNLLTIRELESEIALGFAKIAQFTGDSTAVRTDQAASIDVLRQIAAAQKKLPVNHPAFDWRAAEVNLEQANLKYINSQNRQVFNNFNVGYQRPLYLTRPNKFNTFNNFSFRVGLTAPLPGNNNFKKADAAINLLDAQQDLDWTRVSAERNAENQHRRLEALFQEYSLVEAQEQNSLIAKMLQNKTLMAQITPLEIVELEIEQQVLVVRKAEIQAKIAQEYVKMLDLTGAMSARPLVNYFSATLEGF